MYRSAMHGNIKAPNIWIWLELWVPESKWWELEAQYMVGTGHGAPGTMLNF